MKKILTILAIATSVTLGYSQGTVNFTTIASSYLVSTNDGVGDVGGTATAAGSYYYALLTQTYTGAASSTINANPLTTWTFSGAMATNSTLRAGGINGGSQAIAGWTPGSTAYVEIVGWSADMGTTWAAAEALISAGNLTAADFWGHSVVGYVVSGGAGTPPGPANTLFTANGISGGFQLTNVPEPTTIALIGIGGLGLAMIRRRK
jgi:hypothetical protein